MSSNGESSAEVQREAEVERAELVNTLDRLRENLKPANVIDEVLATARISPADISDKVWQTARDNPIPATLIALGAAMLVGVGARMGGSTPSSPSLGLSGRDGTPADTYEVTDPDRRISSQLKAADDRVLSSASQIASSARTLRREASRPTASASSNSKVKPGVKSMAYSSRSRDRLSGSLSRLLEEQPLVLAAIGVAVGAAIGAALPGTETEGRLMGDASVSLKGRAQDLAQSELAHLRETASTTIDQLKQNAADHGLSKDNLTGLLQDTNSTVRGAVSDATDHAANAAGLKGESKPT